jgi:hypothetical protein
LREASPETSEGQYNYRPWHIAVFMRLSYNTAFGRHLPKLRSSDWKRHFFQGVMPIGQLNAPWRTGCPGARPLGAGSLPVSQQVGYIYGLAVIHPSEFFPSAPLSDRSRRHVPMDPQVPMLEGTGCLLNLPHWLLDRSSGGSQHHESSSEQKHELQAPRNQESCNREGDGGYSERG